MGAAYREAIFRLADHAQSREEQEKDDKEAIPADVKPPLFSRPAESPPMHRLPLTGLDGANPLAYLAAVGTLVASDALSHSENRPAWLTGRVALSWGCTESAYTPVLHLPAAPPTPEGFAEFLAERLSRSPQDHPALWVIEMLDELLTDKKGEMDRSIRERFRNRCLNNRILANRPYLDWATALVCESVPASASQLQTVRRDYMLDNLRSVMARTTSGHLRRACSHPGITPTPWTTSRCTGNRARTAAMPTSGTCPAATRRAKSAAGCSGPAGRPSKPGRCSRRSRPANAWRPAASRGTVPATPFGPGRCGVSR